MLWWLLLVKHSTLTSPAHHMIVVSQTYVSPILRHVSQVLSILHSFPAVAVPTGWFKPCFLFFAGGDSLPVQPWGGMRQCVSCCCLPRLETRMELTTGKQARAFQSRDLKESWLMESIFREWDSLKEPAYTQTSAVDIPIVNNKSRSTQGRTVSHHRTCILCTCLDIVAVIIDGPQIP